MQQPLDASDEGTGNLLRNADELLRIPLQRLEDSDARVRARALQTLGLLSESRALPPAQHQEVAEKGLQRLADEKLNAADLGPPRSSRCSDANDSGG